MTSSSMCQQARQFPTSASATNLVRLRRARLEFVPEESAAGNAEFAYLEAMRFARVRSKVLQRAESGVTCGTSWPCEGGKMLPQREVEPAKGVPLLRCPGISAVSQLQGRSQH
jgi:hypothetical protein